MIQLIECPRDAMQGWPHEIPTQKKINYLNALLQVGFDTLDFGSFVSPKAIPQMADTAKVLEGLNLEGSATKLLAIIANLRGAEEAAQHEQITYLGFPFSISSTFQQRNTGSTPMESMARIETIQEVCLKKNKQLVVYLSMAFGNPYGDAYNDEILLNWADEMAKREITIISLADTVGLATPKQIRFALETLMPKYPGISIGVHLHSSDKTKLEKLEAAWNAGCKRFDGALKGYGGCPMAQDDLVGNMATEFMIRFFESKKEVLPIDKEKLETCFLLAAEIFS
ncbi:MAG: hydroxymethylglutaryl-CoA lyase [Bacteroidetes bacterium]|nr:hydroxymethylglutaryl-CoA lyase [Bacteroidota bacterium]